jgi:hypothetical protein
MNDWIYFPYYASVALVLWLAGIVLVYIGKKYPRAEKAGIFIIFCGIITLAFFISILWIHLERPPMRTLGETRLWYAFFLPVIGILFYLRWKYKWFLLYSLVMTFVFLMINLRHPENYDKVLMPALQSPWFVPHVVVYIFGYAMLGVSALVGLKGLYLHYTHKTDFLF